MLFNNSVIEVTVQTTNKFKETIVVSVETYDAYLEESTGEAIDDKGAKVKHSFLCVLDQLINVSVSDLIRVVSVNDVVRSDEQRKVVKVEKTPSNDDYTFTEGTEIYF